MKRRMMLYFGSFNPVHNGHTALAEWVVGEGLCDELVMVVSPQNPHKENRALAPEMYRFEMAELACAGSRYPDRIKPSAIEFLLERPSYTVQTLRYLKENCGSEMQFSILIGADLIGSLHEWKSYEEILAGYPVYLYPRPGYEVPADLPAGITYLAGAPLWEASSTDVRGAVERGEELTRWVHPDVARYIRSKGLYSTASRIAALTTAIAARPDEASLYLERGMCHYRSNDWGPAINDFNRVLALDPDHREARQLIEMAQEILAYRYTDIYNP